VLKRDLPDKESGYEADSEPTKYDEEFLSAGALDELPGIETSGAGFSRG